MKNRFSTRLFSKSIPSILALGAFANISYAQTTRSWDGGGVPTTNMDIAANWSGDIVPNGTTNDTAQWDGTVAGPLSLTYTALTTGAGLSSAPGFFFNVLGTQTSPLTINEFSGTSGLRIQNLTVASGAGAVTFGGLAGSDYLTFGSAALLTHTWTNNSANAVTFASDVLFGAGGGVTHAVTFTGPGNWNMNTTLIKSGTGTINVIKDGTGTFNIGTINSLGNAAFTINAGTIDNTSGAALALTVAATTPTSYTFNGDFSYGTAAGTNLNDLSLGTPAVTLGTAAGTSRTITTNGGGLLTVGGVVSNGTTANTLIKAGAGALRLDVANTYTGGTILNAGLLHVNNDAALGTGPLTINGGTLVPRIAWRTLANPTTVGGDFTLGALGFNNQINLSGTVNLGGATRTITVPDTTINPDSILSGVISNGGLTKTGAGQLVLSGANTYAGATTISGGLLQVSGTGSIASTSGITINGTDSKLLLTTSAATPAAINLIQGTLDATGTIGAVSVGGANPTTLANGNGGTGTLTTGALSFAGASTVNVFSAPGAPPITAGTLTTSGTAGAIAINITRTAPWSNGPNNLIAYSSSSANINEFTYTLVSGPALGIRQVIPEEGALVKNGNNIALQINGTSIYWTGLKSNQWTTVPVTGAKNWKQTSDNTATDALDFDDVVFGDNPATNQTVQIDDNDVFPTTTTFSNSTVNYTLASSGGIYGIGGTSLLTKNGTGSVTLNTTNNYSGGTTLNAGTLNVNTATALGVGAVLINGGTLNNTSGAPVVLTSNSAQNWNGDFTFTGTNALDLGNGAVTTGGSGDRIVTVSSGVLGAGELRTATGQGFIKQGAGTLLLTSTGAGAGSSVINGTLNVAAGTIQLNRAEAPDLASTGDITTTGLAGTGTITNGSNFERWVITTATGTFGGKLLNGGSGGLGFNKNGPGVLTLTAANGFTGATTVNGGTLSITGTNSQGGPVNLNGATNNPVLLNLQNSNALGTNALTVSSATRHSGVQLQGGITVPANVSFVTSNDGTTGATVPYAIDNLSGDNTINGNITLRDGGGSSIFQSDSGSLKLTGNVSIIAGQGSRGMIFQGDSTGGNLFSGVLSDLSVTSVASITKNGAGTWTVSGTNTYTGATTVNAGKLIVSGNSPATTGTVTVSSGATLGGNGGFGGPLVVAAGAHHELAVAATPAAQAVRQVASLDLSAVGDILDLTAAATSANGSYTLIHTTTGVITGQTAGVLDDTIVNLTGLSGTVAVVGGDLVLTVGAAPSSPFGTWIAGYPSVPLADRDPGDDPDGDGNSNMVEFALGGTPNNGADNAKIYPMVADSDFDGDSLKELLLTIAVRTGTGTFTGATSKSAPSDDPAYSYIVQGSLDLTTFGQTVNVVPTAVPPAGVTLPAGYTWKTFSLDGSNGTSSKGFLRVIVTH